jgi:Zn-finger nucleic acid-binding protein
MKCPACDRELVELKTGPVVLDACQRGCGGVWFDAHELGKVNQAIPAGPQTSVTVEREPSVTVDEERVRKCIRCRRVKLERKLFSLGTGVIMDCCPKCHGIWLDHGELDSIREETNPTPRPVRSVIRRRGDAKTIPINFGVIQKVQLLRLSQ